MEPTRSPHFLSEAEMAALIRNIQEEEMGEWDRFLSYAEAIEAAPGDVLIRQFDDDRDVFILTAGKLEVRVGAEPDDPGLAIATVTPFAVVGEQSFLDAGMRSATVLAAEPSTVYRLSVAAFDQLCIGAPDLAIAFLFDIARSLSLRDRIHRA